MPYTCLLENVMEGNTSETICECLEHLYHTSPRTCQTYLVSIVYHVDGLRVCIGDDLELANPITNKVRVKRWWECIDKASNQLTLPFPLYQPAEIIRIRSSRGMFELTLRHDSLNGDYPYRARFSAHRGLGSSRNGIKAIRIHRKALSRDLMQVPEQWYMERYREPVWRAEETGLHEQDCCAGEAVSREVPEQAEWRAGETVQAFARLGRVAVSEQEEGPVAASSCRESTEPTLTQRDRVENLHDFFNRWVQTGRSVAPTSQADREEEDPTLTQRERAENLEGLYNLLAQTTSVENHEALGGRERRSCRLRIDDGVLAGLVVTFDGRLFNEGTGELIGVDLRSENGRARNWTLGETVGVIISYFSVCPLEGGPRVEFQVPADMISRREERTNESGSSNQ